MFRYESDFALHVRERRSGVEKQIQRRCVSLHSISRCNDVVRVLAPGVGVSGVVDTCRPLSSRSGALGEGETITALSSTLCPTPRVSIMLRLILLTEQVHLLSWVGKIDGSKILPSRRINTKIIEAVFDTPQSTRRIES
jgi:hypothetical protein